MVGQEEFQAALESGRELSATIRGRYAPSPTGPLHLGNLRTALLSWLQVRLQQGVFVLRIEDLDRPRCNAESVPQILDDLHWLGMDWDEGPDVGGPAGPYTQSERDDYYTAGFEYLQSQGLIFPCYCSRKDIQQAASAPHGKTLVYPGTCRSLGQSAHPNRPPAFRFRVEPGEIEFDDEVLGRVVEDLEKDVGDFVVLRRDKLFAYQLAVVIDDALMGITDVVRGADLLSSTGRQIRLFDTFHAHVPRFWHVPLMLNEAGERLAKRDGSDSLHSLREQNRSSEEVVGRLAHSLGIWPDAPVSAKDLLSAITLDTLRNMG